MRYVTTTMRLKYSAIIQELEGVKLDFSTKLNRSWLAWLHGLNAFTLAGQYGLLWPGCTEVKFENYDKLDSADL